jgi:ribosome-binding protein aMBF1 (putative translation factor)
MPKPHYQLRCAQFCMDRNGAYRYGEVWVHLYGRTLWVCMPCAEKLGKRAGIPTTAQQRAAVRAREAKAQQAWMEPTPGQEPDATPAPSRPTEDARKHLHLIE